ncbi:MAG: beta-galactosidase [Clostridia bacterium]|nr:beta-galactosidase [Clostridia bacterium]
MKPSLLSFDADGFYLNGEPFRILAGEIHYFRSMPSDWERRLLSARDFGLNTIVTYVPWNSHEPSEGHFCFENELDLAAFLTLCKRLGLYVLLRPSPYICSEWELGGLPARLLADRSMTLRSSDPAYLSAVRRYYDRLVPEFLPYLSTRGGPILAVAVENEYGSYACDDEYLCALAAMLRERGVDVPLYTTDGQAPQMLTFGREKTGGFVGVNYRGTQGAGSSALAAVRAYAKDSPLFVGEFWAGRSMHWGEPYTPRDASDTAEAFREALAMGASGSFYMFSGGTNFGFMGGANFGRSYSPREGTPDRYIPMATSYDVDALLDEAGYPTEKYFLCRDVLDDFLGKPRRPHTAPEHKTQALTVPLTECAELFSSLDALTTHRERTHRPRPMEDFGESYGLILYTTTLPAFTEGAYNLEPHRYRDRVTLFADGEYFATFLRDRGLTRRAAGVGLFRGGPALVPTGKERRIDALCENLGRINHGRLIPEERKGMEEALTYVDSMLFGYETRTLPLDDLTGLTLAEGLPRPDIPCFLRARFDAEAGVDTYVLTEGLGHGYLFVNGKNLGRYDEAGPQKTLYLPGALLRERDNELIVLDLAPRGGGVTLSLLDHAVLTGEGQALT